MALWGSPPCQLGRGFYSLDRSLQGPFQASPPDIQARGAHAKNRKSKRDIVKLSKILVTGGAGYIGYSLAKHLASRGPRGASFKS